MSLQVKKKCMDDIGYKNNIHIRSQKVYKNCIDKQNKTSVT